MIFLKAKDSKNRLLYKKSELSKKIKKFIFINCLNNNKYKKKTKSKLLYLFLQKEKRVKTKLMFRCVLTNRGRGNYRPFNVSRLILRDMIHLGLVPGFVKAVW